MKIALIADVHANLPALQAVLAVIKSQGADVILDAGDATGYGAFPDKVVSVLRKNNVISVIGNYDRKVLSLGKDRSWLGKKDPEKKLAFQWAYDHLSSGNRSYLASLPETRKLTLGGKRILICHGSPDSNDEHLYPDTPVRRMRQLAKSAGADIVLCGHSHQPFVRSAGKTIFLNPGSVGRPDDGNPDAGYALLKINKSRVIPTLFRVDYDVRQAVAELRKYKLPESFVRMAEQGRSLDFIRQEDSVLALARHCGYEEEHSRQVAKLSLQLFDELRSLHGLGQQDRFYLQCAATLHDIGFVHGMRKHHKTALELIRTSPLLEFDEQERLIIGSIARYHRKALPSLDHDHYAALNPSLRKTVRLLAGILRLADALDSSHDSIIESLTCKITKQSIIITAKTRNSRQEPHDRIVRKGFLLRHITARKIVVRWI